jgi:hypothetical protein
LAIAVFICGISCAILINLIFGSDETEKNAKFVGTIGSCLVTLLSAAPLKDYFGQRSKITTLRYMKNRYSKLSKDPNGKDDPEFQKLESIFNDLLKKLVGA